MVFPLSAGRPEEATADALLTTLYDQRPKKDLIWPTFDALREQIEKSWQSSPPQFDAISPACKEAVKKVKSEIEERIAKCV